MFNGTNFAFWKVRMRTYIMALGADVWDVVETGYVKPIVLASKDDTLEFSFNVKSMNVILSGLAEIEFVNVMHLESSKEMWDKLIIIYEDNENVKDANLQTYILQFEQLKMKEDETIGKYFLRVEEQVNAMMGLGEKIEYVSLVQKILKSLSDMFNPKVSSIEELNDLKSLSINQLLGTLTAYEMRIGKDKPTSREALFIVDKNEDSEPDEIEEKIMRRIKKGSGKYQGKLPFKCFNCGNIGHFSSKCSHKKQDQNSEGEKKYKPKRFGKKKSLCVNNDDSSKDTDTDSSCEDNINDFMLMDKEDYDNKGIGSDVDDEEVVFELEGELSSIKFQVSIQYDHESSLSPKYNKDNMIPDKKQRDQKMEKQMPRRRSSFSYQNFFHGYCFYCSNFGHKIVNCQIKFRDMQLRRSRNKQYLQHRTKNPMNRQRSTNHFDLLNNEFEFDNCHKFDHKAANYHLNKYKVDPRINPLARNASTWKRKDSEKCGLVLSAQKQKEPWYIDSGCSNHMTGDKDKFLSISKRKIGNVTFGNDEPGKIKGKGMVSLSNGKGKSQNVLLVDGLKYNFLV
jgi:hypothetical protein